MRILPDGYTQLEYIQSSGTQYIDTGFKPNQDTRVLMEAEFTLSSVAARLFGSESSNGTSRFIFAKYSGYYHARYNTATANLSNASITGKFSIDANKNVFTINKTITNSFTYATFQSSNNMYIFAGNTDGNASTPATAKIYLCKVYDNGKLVRNFVPCISKSGQIGLYDLVNDVFYGNAGTGTFTAGPKFGYNKIEYIECSGSQYINTNYSPKSENVVYEYEWVEPTLYSACTLFGSTNASSGTAKWSGAHYKPNASSMYSATGVTDALGTISNIVAVAKNTGKTTINNGQITREQNGTSSSGTYNGSIQNGINIGIFADITATSVIEICKSARIYSWKMQDNGVVVRDYIPVIGTDGVAGLWDNVEKVFYGNAGTGEFIAGPELYGNDEYTILLLHGESIEDSSQKTLPIINAGVAVSDSQSVFGENSLYFNGSNNCLTIKNDIFNFGANDFTVDWWEYCTGNSATRFTISYNNGVGGIAAGGGGDANAMYISSTGYSWDLASSSGAFNKTVNTWVHWAVVRRKNIIRTFRNGELFWSANINGSIYWNGAGFVVGSFLYDANHYFGGYIDEFRVSNIARWASDFAVPISAYKTEPEDKPEVTLRKITVDLVPPMTGEKTENFTINYYVTDDIKTESFAVVEYIDDKETQSRTVTAGELVTTFIESTGMEDGLHTFMLIVDETVEVEYTFYVNNSTVTIETTGVNIEMPSTVNINEKFLISVIVNEMSFTLAKLKIHAGDIYSGEV